MVIVRLSRRGSKNRPIFGVMVQDHRMPRDGRFIEQVGTYDPRSKQGIASLKLDRIAYWESVGAKLSNSVNSLIKRFKVLSKDKITIL